MKIIDLLAFLTAVTLLIRLYSVVKLDTLRGKNSGKALKFIFGGYVFAAMLPILRDGRTEEERRLIKTSNILLVAFYLLFVTTMIVIYALTK